MVHHSVSDLLPVRGSLELGNDAPAGHHTNPVGQAQNLVEVVADQQDGCTGVARAQQPLVNRSARTDVETAARTMSDDDARDFRQFARQHEFLGIAARTEAHSSA